MNSWHILFECVLFDDLRNSFLSEHNISFNSDALLVRTRLVSKSAALLGRRIFERMRNDMSDRNEEDV